MFCICVCCSCVSCVGSRWDCDWCVFENRCTHVSSTCSGDNEIIITGQNVRSNSITNVVFSKYWYLTVKQTEDQSVVNKDMKPYMKNVFNNIYEVLLSCSETFEDQWKNVC